MGSLHLALWIQALAYQSYTSTWRGNTLSSDSIWCHGEVGLEYGQYKGWTGRRRAARWEDVWERRHGQIDSTGQL